MIKIGLTGGLSSGKSTVAHFFAKRGARVLDTDKMVHALFMTEGPLSRRLIRHYGSGIAGPGGTIRRQKLREIITARKDELKVLEGFLHPEIRKRITAEMSRLKKQKGLFVVEVPLLFEAGFDRLFDYTVMVTATRMLSQRLARKRGMGLKTYRVLSQRQWTARRKAKLADAVIRNNGSLRHLSHQVHTVHTHLLKQYTKGRTPIMS